MEKQLEPNRSYKVQEACVFLGISKSTYLRYEQKGILPEARRDGRDWRVLFKEEIEKAEQALKELKLIP